MQDLKLFSLMLSRTPQRARQNDSSNEGNEYLNSQAIGNFRIVISNQLIHFVYLQDIIIHRAICY